MKLPFPGRLLALAVISSLSLAMPLSVAHAEEKPKVALVMKSLANEFFRTMEDGAKDYQKAHPGDFDLVANGIKNETDTGEQIRIVEQMVNSGAKALVIAPADSKALVSAVKKAMDQGVVVINIDNRLDPELLKSKGISVPFVGPDNRGRTHGRRLPGPAEAQGR